MATKEKRPQQLSNGWLAFFSGNYEMAEDLFRNAYRSGIGGKAVIQNLVLTLLKQGKAEEALNLINSEITSQQKKGVDKIKMEWLFRLEFLVKIRLGKITDAFADFHENLALELMICQLDSGFSSLRQAERSKDYFRNFILKIELMESDPFPYFRPSVRSYLLKILQEKITEDLSSKEKSLLLAYRSLLFLSIGEMENALDSAKAAVEERESYTSLISRGKIYYQLGRLSEAYGAFIKAKNLTEKNAEALINMGTVLAKVGDHERGIKLIRNGLRKESSSYAGWKNRVLALLAARKWEKARKAISVMSKMREDRPDVWLHLGIAYLGLRKSKKALEALLKYKQRTEESDDWISMLISLAKHLGE